MRQTDELGTIITEQEPITGKARGTFGVALECGIVKEDIARLVIGIYKAIALVEGVPLDRAVAPDRH